MASLASLTPWLAIGLLGSLGFQQAYPDRPLEFLEIMFSRLAPGSLSAPIAAAKEAATDAVAKVRFKESDVERFGSKSEAQLLAYRAFIGIVGIILGQVWQVLVFFWPSSPFLAPPAPLPH